MAAYFIFTQKVLDADKLNNDYLPKSIETLKAYDPEILVVDENMEVLEGETNETRMVVLKFKSREQGLEWYNSKAYQDIVHLRHEATEGKAVLCNEFDMSTI